MLAAILTLIVSLHAKADVSPASVWEQMQEGTTSRVEAKITGLEILANRVKIEFTVTGDKKADSALLCDDFGRKGDNQYFDSEERRAALFRERVQSVRDALNSGATVEIAYSGPWKPCLQSVNLLNKKRVQKAS